MIGIYPSLFCCLFSLIADFLLSSVIFTHVFPSFLFSIFTIFSRFSPSFCSLCGLCVASYWSYASWTVVFCEWPWFALTSPAMALYRVLARRDETRCAVLGNLYKLDFSNYISLLLWFCSSITAVFLFQFCSFRISRWCVEAVHF